MSDESKSTPSLKHELRTPLNHIIGYCEMLIEEGGDDTAPDAPQRNAMVADLQRIHSAGRRLQGVIDGLFDESIPESVRLDEARIHHEVRTPLNQIIGYSELLQEEAREREDGGCVNDLAKIHAAAHRLLALILENFDSTRFTAPQAQAGGANPPVTLLHKDTPGLRTIRSGPGSHPQSTGAILVADDDAANREMLVRRLEWLGHSVSTAKDGREALTMIQSGDFDLLLLDVFMPGMSGYEVLEYLQTNPPVSYLPVIVLSASVDSDQIARCIEMGAEDYLPKPFDPVLLQARIASSLEKKRMRDREIMYLRTIEQEKDRADDLLHVILPSNIAAELKATGEVRPRRVDHVAVLFADVVGFTRYCERRDPETIHRDLQALVRAMESLTTAHGMEKIKTIGDAFLSAAGLINRFGNPALDCVRCGLAMIARARELPAAWQLRVGVHIGPVVAGIVGRERYQFDIWGDTVNAAARMQTEASPGSLCVNAQSWEVLKAHCEGRSLGTRQIKGKGSHEIFQVSGVIAGRVPPNLPNNGAGHG